MVAPSPHKRHLPPIACCIGYWLARSRWNCCLATSPAVKPPKVEETEVESLTADQIGRVLKALEGHYPLQPIAVLALSSGARRGEILALAWKNR